MRRLLPVLLLACPAWAGDPLEKLRDRYGSGGHTVQHDRNSWLLSTGSKGFLNRYSKSSVSEDMAEVFAFLMMRPDLVSKRGEDDAIIEAKVKLLKRHLNRFDASMDEAFWMRGRATENSEEGKRAAVAGAR